MFGARGVAAAGASVGDRPLRHDPEVLRETARELLSRPPYTDQASGPVTDLVARARQWIARLLDALLGTVTGNGVFAWAVVALGTAVLVVLVLRWTRGLSLDRSPSGLLVDDAGRSAADWRGEARALADDGQWAEAVRAGYAAVVADLAEQGVLADAGGRTVGEIDRLVAVDDPAAAPAVARAGRVFEDVWYGHRTAGEADFRTVTTAWSAADTSSDGGR